MAMLISVQSQENPGPELQIDCPKCGATSIHSTSYEQRDRLFLFFSIPTFGVTNTFVICGTCRTKLTSRLSIEELQQHSGIYSSHFLSYEIPFVVKFLVIASILLFIAPFVGLVLAIITVILTRDLEGWPRTLGIVALVLSCIFTIAFFVALAMGI